MGFIASLFLATALAVAPSPHDAASLGNVVERGAFTTPLQDFPSFVRQNRRSFRELDWSTDYCSAPLVGNTGRSFNFRLPCQRHDFAYRNLKLLGRFDETTKRRADETFLADMRETCEPRGVTQRFTCLAWAETFHAAVRLFAG